MSKSDVKTKPTPQTIARFIGSVADPARHAEVAPAPPPRQSPHGKSCLYIRRLDKIDMDVLEQLAILSWQTMAERYPG